LADRLLRGFKLSPSHLETQRDSAAFRYPAIAP
jgi:hypothetical protein